MAFVKQCVADGAAEIKKKGDSGLNEAVNDGGPHLDRLYDVAYSLIEHSGEHYGAHCHVDHCGGRVATLAG